MLHYSQSVVRDQHHYKFFTSCGQTPIALLLVTLHTHMSISHPQGKKCYPQTQAAAEERVCYQRTPSRMVYLNLVVNAVKRLRTQKQAGEAAQELLDQDPQCKHLYCCIFIISLRATEAA